jgi:hypothetical protein
MEAALQAHKVIAFVNPAFVKVRSEHCCLESFKVCHKDRSSTNVYQSCHSSALETIGIPAMRALATSWASILGGLASRAQGAPCFGRELQFEVDRDVQAGLNSA